MINHRILTEAKPYLENRTIKDLVISLSLIAIELDNGDIGLSYMLRDGLPPGCSTFAFAQDLIGQNAWTVAQLLVAGTDYAQRGVAMAVLTAGSRQLPLPDQNPNHPSFEIELMDRDVIGMVGLIPPMARHFQKEGFETIIFDSEISRFNQESKEVSAMEEQSCLLPACDIVILSGTTLINQSLEQLLEWCAKAREIVLVGSSTPMYPEAFKGTGVTRLAGSWWDSEKKDEIFKKISLAGGIRHLSETMIKKSVQVSK